MADVSKIKLPNGTTYDIKDSRSLPLTGGTITGPVIFQDTTSMDEATIGDLVVNGNASFTNNIQANTINGVTVGSSPKFTDTITTATTTGSGNAVTAITASNGVLTVTKGTTFLTSHQDISGKADKATTLAGYGITDAKISSGTITLGSNTITPLTSSSTLNAAKLSGAIPSAVTATTQSASDNSTKIATTAFVQAAMSSAGAGTVTSIGISNGGGLSVSGSPITSSGTITVSHADTSSQASSSNSGRTYIQSVTLDTYGHVTGLSTATETVTNTDEKLKVADASANTSYYPVLTADSTNAENKKYSKIFSFAVTSTYSYLTVGTPGRPGYLVFARSSDYKGYLTSASLTTGDAYWTLPAASGTIALTSDIPTIPSDNVTGSGSTNYLAMWSGTNTLSSSLLSISTSYNSSSDLYGKIKLYVGRTGQLDWQGQLVFYSGNTSKTITITPPSLATGSRTLTLPDASGTIALTSDIPTVPSNIVNKITTTAGTHTVISNQTGNVSFNVPTKTSHLTNDSGFITSYTDEKVKVNFVTGDTVYYLAGKIGNTTGITELSSHGSARMIVSQDIDTIGSTYLALGNSIDQGTAGSKYGAIRLFSRTTKSIDLIAATTLSNDRTIDLPDKSGTVALTSDIPTVPSNIVNTITTTAGAHTTITSQKGDISFSIPTTAAHVGAAASDHTHGNITNGGDITATAPTIANGDQIIINDHSASKITNGPTFDGSTTTTALTPKGTWETFLKSYTETDPTVPSWAKASTKPSYTASEVGALPDTTTIPSNTSDLNNDSGFITLSDVPDISSLIIVDTYTPTGWNFDPSQSRALTKVLTTHSGYTPYVLKCVCINKVSLIVYNYYISSGTLTYEVVNRTSSNVSGANFSIAIMWIKDDILGS